MDTYLQTLLGRRQNKNNVREDGNETKAMMASATPTATITTSITSTTTSVNTSADVAVTVDKGHVDHQKLTLAEEVMGSVDEEAFRTEHISSNDAKPRTTVKEEAFDTGHALADYVNNRNADGTAFRMDGYDAETELDTVGEYDEETELIPPSVYSMFPPVNIEQTKDASAAARQLHEEAADHAEEDDERDMGFTSTAQPNLKTAPPSVKRSDSRLRRDYSSSLPREADNSVRMKTTAESKQTPMFQEPVQLAANSVSSAIKDGANTDANLTSPPGFLALQNWPTLGESSSDQTISEQLELVQIWGTLTPIDDKLGDGSGITETRSTAAGQEHDTTFPEVTQSDDGERLRNGRALKRLSVCHDTMPTAGKQASLSSPGGSSSDTEHKQVTNEPGEGITCDGIPILHSIPGKQNLGSCIPFSTSEPQRNKIVAENTMPQQSLQSEEQLEQNSVNRLKTKETIQDSFQTRPNESNDGSPILPSRSSSALRRDPEGDVTGNGRVPSILSPILAEPQAKDGNSDRTTLKDPVTVLKVRKAIISVKNTIEAQNPGQKFPEAISPAKICANSCKKSPESHTPVDNTLKSRRHVKKRSESGQQRPVVCRRLDVSTPSSAKEEAESVVLNDYTQTEEEVKREKIDPSEATSVMAFGNNSARSRRKLDTLDEVPAGMRSRLSEERNSDIADSGVNGPSRGKSTATRSDETPQGAEIKPISELAPEQNEPPTTNNISSFDREQKKPRHRKSEVEQLRIAIAGYSPPKDGGETLKRRTKQPAQVAPEHCQPPNSNSVRGLDRKQTKRGGRKSEVHQHHIDTAGYSPTKETTTSRGRSVKHPLQSVSQLNQLQTSNTASSLDGKQNKERFQKFEVDRHHVARTKYSPHQEGRKTRKKSVKNPLQISSVHKEPSTSNDSSSLGGKQKKQKFRNSEVDRLDTAVAGYSLPTENRQMWGRSFKQISQPAPEQNELSTSNAPSNFDKKQKLKRRKSEIDKLEIAIAGFSSLGDTRNILGRSARQRNCFSYNEDSPPEDFLETSSEIDNQKQTEFDPRIETNQETQRNIKTRSTQGAGLEIRPPSDDRTISTRQTPQQLKHQQHATTSSSPRGKSEQDVSVGNLVHSKASSKYWKPPIVSKERRKIQRRLLKELDAEVNKQSSARYPHGHEPLVAHQDESQFYIDLSPEFQVESTRQFHQGSRRQTRLQTRQEGRPDHHVRSSRRERSFRQPGTKPMQGESREFSLRVEDTQRRDSFRQSKRLSGWQQRSGDEEGEVNEMDDWNPLNRYRVSTTPPHINPRSHSTPATREQYTGEREKRKRRQARQTRTAASGPEFLGTARQQRNFLEAWTSQEADACRVTVPRLVPCTREDPEGQANDERHESQMPEEREKAVDSESPIKRRKRGRRGKWKCETSDTTPHDGPRRTYRQQNFHELLAKTQEDDGGAAGLRENSDNPSTTTPHYSASPASVFTFDFSPELVTVKPENRVENPPVLPAVSEACGPPEKGDKQSHVHSLRRSSRLKKSSSSTEDRQHSFTPCDRRKCEKGSGHNVSRSRESSMSVTEMDNLRRSERLMDLNPGQERKSSRGSTASQRRLTKGSRGHYREVTEEQRREVADLAGTFGFLCSVSEASPTHLGDGGGVGAGVSVAEPKAKSEGVSTVGLLTVHDSC